VGDVCEGGNSRTRVVGVMTRVGEVCGCEKRDALEGVFVGRFPDPLWAKDVLKLSGKLIEDGTGSFWYCALIFRGGQSVACEVAGIRVSYLRSFLAWILGHPDVNT